MRLDKYLKVSRLIKRRTVANEVADAGRILINGSEYFWEIVTRQRSLALGGNSRREHFPTKENCIDYIDFQKNHF